MAIQIAGVDVAHVARAVISARKRREWTQQQLAERCGVPRPTLAKLETGDASLAVVVKVLGFLAPGDAACRGLLDQIRMRATVGADGGAPRAVVQPEEDDMGGDDFIDVWMLRRVDGCVTGEVIRGRLSPIPDDIVGRVDRREVVPLTAADRRKVERIRKEDAEAYRGMIVTLR